MKFGDVAIMFRKKMDGMKSGMDSGMESEESDEYGEQKEPTEEKEMGGEENGEGMEAPKLTASEEKLLDKVKQACSSPGFKMALREYLG
jgi:hypothetical protein